jgi:DNA primase
VEGYTDVLALHQAGLRNCVGIMGTALTEDQVGELSRLAQVVLLALDSDSAGHEAMLRAARVAEGRKLELRVVSLPQGKDPADMVGEAGGAARLTELVDGSMPFVRFRVERALATGNVRDAEGKDDVIAQLRPVFATLPPSVLREELLSLLADRLSLSPELVGSLLAQGRRLAEPAPESGGAARAPRRLPAQELAEREFLAYCIAFPELGSPALAELELDRDFTAESTRRVAAHLRDHGVTGEVEDPELAGLLTALKVSARAPEILRGRFEVQRLQLALGRVRRDIAAAPPGEKTALAKRREELQQAYNDALDRSLEQDRLPAE